MEATLLYKTDTKLGEGPVWNERRQLLSWLDILNGRLHEYNPVTGENHTHTLGMYIGASVLRPGGNGYVLATYEGFIFYDPEALTCTPIVNPKAHQPRHRFNDGKCDPSGRFWAGTMELMPIHPTGALYCLEPDGTLIRKLEGLTCSNGLAWSPARSEMYFIDSPTLQVQCFDYDDATGDIAFKRTAVTFDADEGFPDGMTIDAEGNLWVAMYGGGQVFCHDPVSGKRLATVKVPTPQTTCPTFGGPNLDILYITTGAEGMHDEEDPLAGGLFAVEPGVKGVLPDRFGT
ncbi:Sugar lactone lactonase YvrE [Catalinimonas alkaloidigena]|uniref:Regucalcin n=1 Tax=Catalinimonas alkaloidigena TaxID=1075417 RepID=A0A1G9K2E4_9BACT|nr:SMP-30/gluconolactonase/LRE family protein [Catalinimonas alkaloidigena]SDL43373.1 Sugar lactone lactonase YvrE [Catalinimonas alkaloidigena]